MDRRELLQILSSAALSPALSRLTPDQRLALGRTLHGQGLAGPRVLTSDQEALVTSIAELIIPATESPGATDAKVSTFVDTLLAGWYDDDDKARFLRGLAAIDAEAMALGQTNFVNATPNTQHALLVRWDSSESGPETATAQFKRLKDLTVYGYFTSEIVVKNVTKPIIFHPSFEGCTPFTAGRIQ
jgi:hypothetical protein